MHNYALTKFLNNVIINITIYNREEKEVALMKRITKILSFVFALAMIFSCVPAELSASAAGYNWAGAWGTPAIESGVVVGGDSDDLDSGMHLQDYIPARSTVRTIITPTLSGTKIRLKFSNYYSPDAVTLGEVTIAKTGATKDLIKTDTLAQVTFNGGQKSITIAAGSEVYSDEINFNIKALEDVSVSVYYPKTTTMYTIGLYGGVAYLASSLGNRTHKEDMTLVASRLTFTSGSITYYTIPFLTRLDVYAQDAYSVVLLGDSTLTNEISVMLAKKLQANGIKNVGFVMSGIIGNALLTDGHGLLGKVYGDSLLERAKRDAFNVAGVKYVIVKIGENDILHPMLKSNAGMKQVYAPAIIQGYKDLAKQAYGKDIDLYLCTRTPYKGYTRNFMGSDDLEWSQKGEDILLEINKWVKNDCTKYQFAGCIDLDNIRDPKDSTKLRTHMTTDGIHFSEYGQIAVTDLIPEKAYGVNYELRDYADIIGINPYVAPAVPETTTKAPAQNNNQDNNDDNNNADENENNAPETTTATNTNQQQNQGNNIQNNFTGDIIIQSPETTTSNANQILVDNPQGNSTVQGNVSDADTKAVRQMAGFSILATVAMAIIAVASVLLMKMRPSANGIARGGKGRANQKKRV